jgi:hypothetical protein
VIHVYPKNDICAHDTGGVDCVCGPRIEGDVVIHHSLDGRENRERKEPGSGGRAMTPATPRQARIASEVNQSVAFACGYALCELHYSDALHALGAFVGTFCVMAVVRWAMWHVLGMDKSFEPTQR